MSGILYLNSHPASNSKPSRRSKSWQRWCRTAFQITLPVATGILLYPSLAPAATVTWNVSGTIGNWSTAVRWSSSPGLPQPGDAVVIQLSNSNPNNTVSFDVSTSYAYGSLQVDDNSTSHILAHGAEILQSANILNVSTTESVGDSTGGAHANGYGSYVISGGANNVGTLILGKNATDSGSYVLSGTGTLTSTNFTLGASGSGFMSQTAGSNTSANIYMGNGGLGTYSLSGTGNITSFNEEIGVSSTGNFSQSGGTNNPTNLVMGVSVGSTASYSFSGGVINAGSETLGVGGSAVFTEGNADHFVNGPLYVGYSSGSSGTYSMSTGLLQVTHLHVGESGSGTFIQTGGYDYVVGDFYLGNSLGSSGTYSLSTGANLTPNNTDLPEYIGNNGSGTFIQTGGTNSLFNGNLYLGYGNSGNGVYSLSGGSLEAGGELIGFNSNGSFTQSGGTNSGGGTVAIGISAPGSYNMSAGSLTSLIEYIGQSNSATFTQTGGTHTNTGEIDLGFSASGTGSYSLSNPATILNSASEFIGNSGSGTFTQTDGINTLTAPFYNFFMALSAGSTGLYVLNGGVLQTTGTPSENPYEGVGYGGNGTFIQTAGTNSLASTGSLNIGVNTGSSGTYSLSGSGLVSIPTEKIGISGTAVFMQSGGVNLTSVLDVGLPTAATGTYSLSGTGYLSSSGEIIGDGGNGTFIQSGGNHIVNGSLFIGHNGGSGTGHYSLSGSGSLLVAGNEFISTSGPGSFIQSGGTHTVLGAYALDIFGAGDGSTAYSLTGGTVTAGTVNIQSGVLVVNGTGALTATSSLSLSGAAGTAVNLIAGSITTPNLSSNGTSFNQTGGTLAVTSTLIESGGTITLGGPQTLNIPTISLVAGTTTLTTDAKKLIITSSISTIDGHLDLTKNSLILHSTTTHLTTDFNGLYDDMGATQIFSSNAPLMTGGTALGLLKAADYLALNGPSTLFAGQIVTSTDILIKYTYRGDANLDGKITADDYAQLDAGFLLQPANPAWVNGDYNFDGLVNYQDYAAIDAGLLAYQGNGPLAQLEISQHSAEFGAPYLAALQADTTPSPIPEPTTLILLALPLLIRKLPYRL